jgi:hypothetical protein
MNVLDQDFGSSFDLWIPERLDTFDSGIGGQFEVDEALQGFSDP